MGGGYDQDEGAALSTAEQPICAADCCHVGIGLHVTKHLGFLMENGNLDFYEKLIFFKCLQKHLQANQPGASHFVASAPAGSQSRDHFCSAFCSHCQALGLAQN